MSTTPLLKHMAPLTQDGKLADSGLRKSHGSHRGSNPSKNLLVGRATTAVIVFQRVMVMNTNIALSILREVLFSWNTGICQQPFS